MKVIITEDYEEMSRKAFEIMVETVKTSPTRFSDLQRGLRRWDFTAK